MRGRLPIILTIALLATSLPASATAAEAPWTPVTPAITLPATVSSVGLFDVAAVSPEDVWTVGDAWDDVTGDAALIAHWTGAGWQRVKEPSVRSFQYTLWAVDAVSAQDVWAVGDGNSILEWGLGPFTAVIAHYDGTRWSMTPAPAPPPSHDYVLKDVDIMSATNGWAVGMRGGPPDMDGIVTTQPLVMRWRNGRWVTVNLPAIDGGSAMLEHVYARADNDVWAVGSAGHSSLVMHFDGTRWSRTGVPRGVVADAYDELRAVTAISANEVWAAGASCTESSGLIVCQPLILHLSGGVWRVVPTAGDRGTFLLDVVARSSNDVWMIGYDLPEDGQEANYVEHWDGQRFTTVAADAGSFSTRSGLASALEAATRIPGTAELWAVGWQNGNPQVIRHG